MDKSYKKAWLVKKLLPSTGLHCWVFTTRKQRAVSILGSSVGNASYSEFTPGQATSSIPEKIHTIFCNDMNNELAEQYIAQAGGNLFYMGIPFADDEPCTIVTPDEYNASISSDDREQVVAQ